MSDDEAFIRRIVDSPGDDLPRLVYADWLDERDDLRGAYLRAEVKWAHRVWFDLPEPDRSWRIAPPIPDEMHIGLDPVWVARVSRPPVGVCCDHLGLTPVGPPVEDEALNDVERVLSVRLPVHYRAFLRNWNGAAVPACLVNYDQRGVLGRFATRFHPLGDEAIRLIQQTRGTSDGRETLLLLAVAGGDRHGCPVLIGLGEDYWQGRVQFDMVPGSTRDEVGIIPRSLGSFLGKLSVEVAA